MAITICVDPSGHMLTSAVDNFAQTHRSEPVEPPPRCRLFRHPWSLVLPTFQELRVELIDFPDQPLEAEIFNCKALPVLCDLP